MRFTVTFKQPMQFNSNALSGVRSEPVAPMRIDAEYVHNDAGFVHFKDAEHKLVAMVRDTEIVTIRRSKPRPDSD